MDDQNARAHVPNDPLDVRNKREFVPKRRTLTTERADWLRIAHSMVDEAIVLPEEARHIAKDCMVVVQLIIVGLRNTRPPIRPDDRITIHFRGQEFMALMAWSSRNPRQGGQIAPIHN